ncbi:hypothetical protein JKP88DRAFT_280509 [Tribonema minus]|uniref:Uncharacterized protein n=1 Tax=Tribonema minus TaxID=303371 RepID=A0A835YPR8_9STRA|nr:hypothetical protein JKP88DRAFT_280509 [Tribonema minus]
MVVWSHGLGCSSRSSRGTGSSQERKDNLGFAHFVLERADVFQSLVNAVRRAVDDEDSVVFLAGEWCGDAIQKNVALCELPRMFIVFHVSANGGYQPLSVLDEVMSTEITRSNSVYCITLVTPYVVTIDLRDTAAAAAALGEVTEAVDERCPFAAALGAVGHGEGVVWKMARRPQCSSLWFKTKGAAHEMPARGGGIKPVKLASLSDCRAVREYVAAVCTNRRLEQGLEYITEMYGAHDMRNVVEFAEWVERDALREHDCGDVAAAQLSKVMRATVIPWFNLHIESCCM